MFWNYSNLDLSQFRGDDYLIFRGYPRGEKPSLGTKTFSASVSIYISRHRGEFLVSCSKSRAHSSKKTNSQVKRYSFMPCFPHGESLLNKIYVNHLCKACEDLISISYLQEDETRADKDHNLINLINNSQGQFTEDTHCFPWRILQQGKSQVSGKLFKRKTIVSLNKSKQRITLLLIRKVKEIVKKT